MTSDVLSLCAVLIFYFSVFFFSLFRHITSIAWVREKVSEIPIRDSAHFYAAIPSPCFVQRNRVNTRPTCPKVLRQPPRQLGSIKDRSKKEYYQIGISINRTTNHTSKFRTALQINRQNNRSILWTVEMRVSTKVMLRKNVAKPSLRLIWLRQEKQCKELKNKGTANKRNPLKLSLSYEELFLKSGEVFVVSTSQSWVENSGAPH